MSDYRLQIVKHNGIPCLHVIFDDQVIDANGFEKIIQTYIPLDDIASAAMKQGYAIYAMPDAVLQKICESQGYTRHSLPAQKIRDVAQKALNTNPHYPSVLSHALEDIIELCQAHPAIEDRDEEQ